MTPIAIVAYLLLFVGVGFVFVLACLLLGWLLRPRAPRPEKREIYECGEPTVGPGFVQFDLRFYVVALVFLFFEVEVGFFFPWAVVFGKAAQLRDAKLTQDDLRQLRIVVAAERGTDVGQRAGQLDAETQAKLSQLGIERPDKEISAQAIEIAAGRLARMAMADIAVFFGVLLVGFAYVWKRGDLNWVRALAAGSSSRVRGPGPAVRGAAKE
jgi:NADH-quinone oxidoreductase subunit A